MARDWSNANAGPARPGIIQGSGGISYRWEAATAFPFRIYRTSRMRILHPVFRARACAVLPALLLFLFIQTAFILAAAAPARAASRPERLQIVMELPGIR